jgi:hypothetical protein
VIIPPTWRPFTYLRAFVTGGAENVLLIDDNSEGVIVNYIAGAINLSLDGQLQFFIDDVPVVINNLAASGGQPLEISVILPFLTVESGSVIKVAHTAIGPADEAWFHVCGFTFPHY